MATETAQYLTIDATTTVNDVGPETMDALEKATLDIVDGWYEGVQIDWEDVWDRLDNADLPDDRKLDLIVIHGPVVNALKRRIYGR